MHNIIAATLPEIMLTLVAISTQIFALFFKKFSKCISKTTIILVGIIISYMAINVSNNQYMILLGNNDNQITTIEISQANSSYELKEEKFHDIDSASFITNKTINQQKIVILILAMMIIMLYNGTNIISDSKIKIEFNTLLLLATIGSFLAISAQDFLTLICGLEMQALCAYILVAINVNDPMSSNSAIKYFISGAIMSVVMIFGISLLYGFSDGNISYTAIYKTYNTDNLLPITLGTILVLSTIFFKMSAAPFHFWTAEVYEGSPTTSLAYISILQKFTIVLVFAGFCSWETIYSHNGIINIMNESIPKNIHNILYLFQEQNIYQSIIKWVAILSLLIGSIGGVLQSSIKRIIAFSTILNIGFILCAFYLRDHELAKTYIFVYAFSLIALLASLIGLFGNKIENINLSDLNGVANMRKTISIIMTLILFSMIGLPPFAGFFIKYFLFTKLIYTKSFLMLGITFLASIIGAIYYLRIIKHIYFMKPNQEFKVLPTNFSVTFVSLVSMLVITFFFLFI